MLFAATFRSGQPLAQHYVVIEAHDWYSAREIMDHMYGGSWDSIYESPAPLERRGLTPVAFGKMNCELS